MIETYILYYFILLENSEYSNIRNRFLFYYIKLLFIFQKMNKNDAFVSRKKSLLNSLKILINSNKNFFESHKFDLVQNLQSSSNTATSSSSSSSSSNTASSVIVS